MKSISEGLVRKFKIYQLQQEDVDMLQNKQEDEDSDFGLVIDPSIYVRFDDKVKFAEMLKLCTRDKLT